MHTACCIGISSTIKHGATMIIRRKFSASNFWKVINTACTHYRL